MNILPHNAIHINVKDKSSVVTLFLTHLVYYRRILRTPHLRNKSKVGILFLIVNEYIVVFEVSNVVVIVDVEDIDVVEHE